MKKLLKCYPFALLNPEVKLVEGFLAYDGVLGDEKGKAHKGIDYIRRDKRGRFISFEVFSTHGGYVHQYTNDSFGKFVIIYMEPEKNYQLATIYAHLRDIHSQIPNLSDAGTAGFNKGLKIEAGAFLGKTGTTGFTKRKIQLHFEIQKANLKTHKIEKLDPYGLYLRASSKKYPQPGKSLKKCRHFWTSNDPPFAKKLD